MKNEAQYELFTNEEKAIAFWESKRWPNGPICPHCGLVGEAYKLQGKSTRPGLWKCKDCRKPFTAKMRSIFEDSKIPMHMWMYAVHLMCSSKKGMSAFQFHRMTATFYGRKVSYRTAWFMFHRIRFAMTQHPFVDKLKGVVEVDETWIGPKQKGSGLRGTNPLGKKRPVVSLLERSESGSRVRSFPVERVTAETVKAIMRDHVEAGANLQTDEAAIYHFMHDLWPDHDTVTHSKNIYSRRENGRHITTNTVEGYFGLLKRGLYGTYHHVGKPYLQQYLNEFDFRYNNRKITDAERTDVALKATEGKRLTLRRPVGLQ
jgi:transposase-like protein